MDTTPDPRLNTAPEVETEMLYALLDDVEGSLGAGSELGEFYPQRPAPPGESQADVDLRRAVRRATRGGALVRFPSPLLDPPHAQWAAVRAFVRRAAPIMEVLAERNDIVATTAESAFSVASEAARSSAVDRSCDGCERPYGPAQFLALPPAEPGTHDVTPGHDVRRCPCGDVVYLSAPGTHRRPWHSAFRTADEEARGVALARRSRAARRLLLSPDLPWRHRVTGEVVVPARLRVPAEGAPRVAYDRASGGRASMTLRGFARRFAPAPRSLPRLQAAAPFQGPDLVTVLRADPARGLALVAHDGARALYDVASGLRVRPIALGLVPRPRHHEIVRVAPGDVALLAHGDSWRVCPDALGIFPPQAVCPQVVDQFRVLLRLSCTMSPLLSELALITRRMRALREQFEFYLVDCTVVTLRCATERSPALDLASHPEIA